MLRYRLQSGLLMGVALLAAALFCPPWAVLLILLATCGLALYEFYALLDARQIPHFKVVGMLGGLALIAGTWTALRSGCPVRDHAEPVILFAITAAIFLRQISYKESTRPWETMAGSLLGITYVAFLLNFFTKLLASWEPQVGRYLILYMAAVVKSTDMGAYFVGCSIGRHKFIPRISPGKTWEGVIGGVLTGVAASAAFQHFTGGGCGAFCFSLGEALGLGAVLAVAGVAGDLIESLLKRASGVKDSGTFIQGMGGLLDVIDSLLFAAPILYAFALFKMT